MNFCIRSSWVAGTEEFQFYFGGDTGYCGDVFRSIRECCGSMDLSAIPIAAYGVPAEAWFHKPNHMNPEESVKCHMDLESRQSVAIHWGTFTLTGEHVGHKFQIITYQNLKYFHKFIVFFTIFSCLIV